MVKALHRAGIEVILDVVYNHTAESDENGPTISFRGLSNETYYILAADRSRYANFTGCGNTLNANEPIVRRLILDSLRYWVSEMHVDGFRFDLASVLARDEAGRPMASPPILWDIESDPVLANVKLIAEPWDPGGLYQVGTFVGDSWTEWNGRFRDDVRAFLKGDSGVARAMAFRLSGSPDVYAGEEREAEQSINFVTCHDGFTLNDLVSFNAKHNEANGESNRDGTDQNLSWNCGVEGATADPDVERLRNRQVKNFLALTLLSIGTPMLLMGDEVRRTQRGNNNAYCQNNEISWFDWTSSEKHADIHRFAKTLIAMRMNRHLPIERLDLTLNELLRRQPFTWHGVRLNAPDWSHESHTLAATVALRGISGDAPPHRQCVLGSARVRASRADGGRRGVAALPRHLARCTGGHLWLEGCPVGAGAQLSGPSPLRGRARGDNRGRPLTGFVSSRRARNPAIAAGSGRQIRMRTGDAAATLFRCHCVDRPCADWHGAGRDGGRQPTRPSPSLRSTLPGSAPVWAAFSTTTVPLTITVVRAPVGYWCGSA